MWWFGPPAVVKGWIDRVFVPGLTYGRGAWFETGGMKGKRGKRMRRMAGMNLGGMFR